MHKPILHILLITAVGLLAYSNTFDVPFLFDDSESIVENSIIKDLTYFVEPSKAKALKGPKGLFEYKTFRLRYIGYLTFALNYKLHGLNVAGYHIFNIAVHVINALLIYWLVLLTLKMPFVRTTYSEIGILQTAPSALPSHWIALFSALLFVSHPVQTQAVTYICQRLASLTAAFYLFSLLMYIKARLSAQSPEFRTQNTERRRRLSSLFCYLLSFVSAVLAMKTKAIAFTLPLIIALYEFMFFQDRLKSRILYLIPVFSTMLIIPLALLGTDKPIGELIGDVSEATRLQTTMSRLDYLFTQFRVIVTYIRLLILPINQNLDYDYPTYNSFFDPNVFLSFLFIAVILSIGVYLLYRWDSASHHSRLISFGIFWFFITLSVESGIIPIVDVIFEHRVYLPSVGFILVCVTGLAMLVQKVKSKVVVRIIVVGVITAVVMLGGMTYGRNRVWQNEIALWEDVVKKSPEKSRPHNNLGSAYGKQDRLDEAISAYKAAVLFRPDYADAYNNLGNIYDEQNRFDEAISAYAIAIQLRRNDADAYNNLGVTYSKQDRLDEAISAYKAAVLFRPDYADAYYNLGNAYRDKGLPDKAIEQYHLALKLKPGNAKIYNNMGSIYDNIGLTEKAIEQYRIALRLEPYEAIIHFNLGIAYERKGLRSEAINEYETALKINPSFTQAMRALKAITN